MLQRKQKIQPRQAQQWLFTRHQSNIPHPTWLLFGRNNKSGRFGLEFFEYLFGIPSLLILLLEMLIVCEDNKMTYRDDRAANPDPFVRRSCAWPRCWAQRRSPVGTWVASAPIRSVKSSWRTAMPKKKEKDEWHRASFERESLDCITSATGWQSSQSRAFCPPHSRWDKYYWFLTVENTFVRRPFQWSPSKDYSP